MGWELNCPGDAGTKLEASITLGWGWLLGTAAGSSFTPGAAGGPGAGRSGVGDCGVNVDSTGGAGNTLPVGDGLLGPR